MLRDQACNIARNPKYDGYQRGLASMTYKTFDKKTSGGGIKNENIYVRPAIGRTFVQISYQKIQEKKIQSPFKDNIWGADLVDMQLISKFRKRFRFLLCVICIYSKYAWVTPLKD